MAWGWRQGSAWFQVWKLERLPLGSTALGLTTNTGPSDPGGLA